MKAVKIFIVVFSFTVLLGCKEEYSFKRDVRHRIEEDAKNIIANDYSRERSKRLFDLISSSTNNLLRIKLFTEWGDSVLAAKIPVHTNDYRVLRRIIGNVEDRILQEVTWGLQDDCEGAKENVFDMRFKLVEWQEDRLDELLAISKKFSSRFDFQYSRWEECYTVLFHSYRGAIDMMESKWFTNDLRVRKTPPEVKERIRVKIENFLGRKMRTEKEVDANWGRAREIYRKGKKYRLL
jgi:hypothetical protein